MSGRHETIQALIKPLALAALLSGQAFLRAGEIADYYFGQLSQNPKAAQTAAGTSQSSDGQMLLPTNRGITEIGIERTTCFGKCPAYTFIARGDGTFRYHGEKNVEHLGVFSGEIPIWNFRELARFITDSGYMELKNEYTAEVTDCPTTFTTVVENGKRKVIRNYANAGPSKLWAIEEIIDGLMAKSEWGPGNPNAPSPILPTVTRFDGDPVLRAAYLLLFQQGYDEAWNRKEHLPVTNPTTDVDKARVLGYADGMLAGRSALAKWFGTNIQNVASTNLAPAK